MERELEMPYPQFGEVVARLKAAPSMRVGAGFRERVMRAIAARRRWRMAFAAAAAIAMLLGAASIFNPQIPTPGGACDGAEIALADGSRPAASVAPYVLPYAVRSLVSEGLARSESLSRAVAEIVSSQNADGGWGVPALTALNTAALGLAVRVGDNAAVCAWKRGVRHLRAHGIPETDPF